MTRNFFVIFFTLCFQICFCADIKNLEEYQGKINNKIQETPKKVYEFADDPIDVVIVSHPKDKETIDLCIDGIRDNCSKVRRVIVVSSEPLSDKAEWFDEANYPFSKDDVNLQIGRGSLKTAERFIHLHGRGRGIGWYYQQLLKLYAAFVIPDISSNVLILDSDTVFLKPVTFLTDSFAGQFSFSGNVRDRYVNHAKRLVPGYIRAYPKHFSVCHHMLFQKPILDDLFNLVEAHHKTEFWRAFCDCVDLNEGGASEYEMYYSFAFSQTNQVKLRPLRFKDSPYLENISIYKRQGYHFVSFHSYMRDRMQKQKAK